LITELKQGPGSENIKGSRLANWYAFHVVTLSRTFVLAAPTEEERQDWLYAIRSLMAHKTPGLHKTDS
jgi:hypothetical protein